MPALRAAVFVAALVPFSLAACTTASDDAGRSSTQHLEEFTDLSKLELSFPENLGRPPTIDEITLVRGYDGKTPAEVATIVKGNFEGKLHPSNEDLVRRQALTNHKRWTMVLANVFGGKDFPAAQFVETVASEGTSVFILTTIRGEVFLLTSHPEEGDQWYVAKGYSFEPVAAVGEFAPSTPPIARAELRLNPPGLRIDYPRWKYPVLTKQLTTIEELGGGKP